MGAAIALFFIAALILAGIIALSVSRVKSGRRLIDSLTNKLNLGNELRRFSLVNYLGGHPSLPYKGTATFSFRERGFVMVVNGGRAVATSYQGVSGVTLNPEVKYDHKKHPVNVTRIRFNMVVKGGGNANLMLESTSPSIASQLVSFLN